VNMKKMGVLVVSAAVAASLTACSSSGSQSPQSNTSGNATTPSSQGKTGAAGGTATLINAAGSTFVNPLFSKQFSEYQKDHTDIKVNYQSIGSGGGIKQLIAKTVDFGASDAPMNANETKSAGGNVLHIPVTLGGVAIAYNLPGVKDLKLTSQNIADIYNGKIKKWNDASIVKNNPSAKLPAQDIFPVHRSDGSGTSYIFTSYLNAAAPASWKKEQVGKSIKWANAGTGAKGNEGVAGQVQNTPGSIGYVELAYVLQNNMTAAQVQNKDGQFVSPSLDTVSTAAAGALKNMPKDLKVSLVNEPGKNSYPIVGTTWALVYADNKDQAKTEKVVNLLKWAVTDGQKYATELQYAPLPKQIQDLDIEQLKKVKANGAAVLK
jgi:phosphate transport system substrate-binding protein